MKFKIYEAVYVGCWDGYDSEYEWKKIGTMNIPKYLCVFNFIKVYFVKKKLKQMGMEKRHIFLSKKYQFYHSYEIEPIIRNNKLFI